MKKFLLLVCICTIVNCHAQQKELDSLLTELKQHPQEDTVRLNLLYSIAMAYYYSNPDKGIVISNEGISLARKLHEEVKLGNALSSKGCNYMAMGKYDTCLALLKTALQIFEKHNYERGAFTVLNIIGIVQFNTSDYGNALNTCTKNLRIAKQSGNSAQIVTAIANLSMVLRATSNYSEALKYNFEAISLLENSTDKNRLAIAYGEAGLIYRELKETDKAKQYYQKALNILIKIDNERDEATILSALGQIFLDEKNYQPALTYYQQAVTISNNTNNVQTAAGTLGSIGDVYKALSKYDSAINYYKKAVVLDEKLGDKNNTAYVLGEIGDAYIKTSRQRNQAISYLRQSLAIAKAISAPDRQQITLNYLSNYYEKQKNYREALSFNKQANVMQDSIFNDKTKDNITRLEMQYQFNKTQDSIKAKNDKQQAIAKSEIQKQHVIEIATIAGVGFLLLAGISGFTLYKRNRDIRTQKNEAQLQQQITETEMKALLSQMKALLAQIKPHFIFNSLNSIADYIEKDQTEVASNFTIKYAKLMRMVLKNSNEKEIPLADDLKALEIYMQLENFRLHNKFNYTIQVDENIDEENTLMPPMILQPLVENSIKHGIAEKEGMGNILITIKKENNMLNCIVDDDGVGMKEAKSTADENKSMGMEITKARIDIINKLKNANASMNVCNKEVGVRAEVKLPLELKF